MIIKHQQLLTSPSKTRHSKSNEIVVYRIESFHLTSVEKLKRLKEVFNQAIIDDRLNHQCRNDWSSYQRQQKDFNGGQQFYFSCTIVECQCFTFSSTYSIRYSGTFYISIFQTCYTIYYYTVYSLQLVISFQNHLEKLHSFLISDQFRNRFQTKELLFRGIFHSHTVIRCKRNQKLELFHRDFPVDGNISWIN